MIQNFLRRPRGFIEILADALRVIGLVSVIAALIWWSWTDAGVLALVLLGLVLPRFLAASAVLDVALGATLLVAGWSSVIDLYRAIEGWDLLVHFAASGLIAAIVYLLLASYDLIPDPDDDQARLATVLILAVSFGLAVSAVWEMLEWVGHTYLDQRIFVGYDDSIGDMLFGGLGSLASGFAIRYLPLRRQEAEQGTDPAA